MVNILDQIKKLYTNKKNLYILMAAGIIILLLSNVFTSSSDKDDKKTQADTYSASMQDEERRLEQILSKVYGAGKTEVMITYDTGIERVTAQNSKLSRSSSTDTEDAGGEAEHIDTSEEKQTVMNGSGNSQTPFIVKEINPKVRGVLVVAEGAGDNTVRYDLTNAVAAVLDVPYYRIQVLQKSD